MITVINDTSLEVRKVLYLYIRVTPLYGAFLKTVKPSAPFLNTRGWASLLSCTQCACQTIPTSYPVT